MEGKRKEEEIINLKSELAALKTSRSGQDLIERNVILNLMNEMASQMYLYLIFTLLLTLGLVFSTSSFLFHVILQQNHNFILNFSGIARRQSLIQSSSNLIQFVITYLGR